MQIPLAELAQASGIRRKRVVLRPIAPTRALEDDLYAIYADSIGIWQRLTRTIAIAYDTPSRIVTDADGQQLQWLIDQASREADARVFYQTEKLGRWVTRVGTWHGQRTISAVKSALGVDISPFVIVSDVRPILEDAVRANVSLIRDVNAKTRTAVEQIIYDGLVNRRTKKYVTDALAAAMKITKKRARFIAGDQTHKLNIALTGYRNEQMGIKSYIWVTRHDDRVRRVHRERDGKVFAWARPPYDGAPGYPPGCRCVSSPIVELG